MLDLDKLITTVSPSGPPPSFRCEACSDRGFVVSGASARRCTSCAPSIEERMTAAGVPERLLGCSREAWQGKWPSLRNFGRGENLLLLTGEPGRGKSFVAVALVRRWLAADKGPARFVEVAPWLEGAVKPAIADGRSSAVVQELCKREGLVVLDDCWAEKATEFNADIVSRLICYRHSRGLHLIVTTNLSLEQIANEEPRVGSRLAGGIVVTLAGRDMRRAIA